MMNRLFSSTRDTYMRFKCGNPDVVWMLHSRVEIELHADDTTPRAATGILNPICHTRPVNGWNLATFEGPLELVPVEMISDVIH